MADFNRTLDRSIQISRSVADLLQRRLKNAHERYAEHLRSAHAGFAQATPVPKTPVTAWQQWTQYQVDFAQRAVLFWDTLRQSGNQWLAHEAAGKPPVLAYKYELIADARTYERPANYALVRIIPPRDVEVDDTKRPFVIVDPRAGHGPGIGGSKEDSEVGVALKAGHPVYFVIFYPDPEPGQTLADITDAEAEFIRIVALRHPHSQKPVIIGNCQGGWAVMMLAAARPDIAGPLVINGAPMSYWSGNDGDSPMRYAGGLLGGTWASLFASDLGGGKFDGAYLVQNFEYLNPANSLWTKWYHLFANIDEEPPRFLEFERWWGGFYLMNEEEIRWITNNLFVGNKLAAGEARLGPGRYFDLKSIKQPIIVFASMGDNITPPQQAFNWIADIYQSTEEIKANGQTIVGLIHEDIGHLGIFVSGKVAKKEHAQIVEVLKYIQALPPGLYGMSIDEQVGADGELTYDVTLRERKVEDLHTLQKYNRVDEKPFEAVAALSELLERSYSLLARPFVRALTPEWYAKLARDLHPLRVQRWAVSDKNPWLWPLPYAADAVKRQRMQRSADNDGVKVERLFSEHMTAALDLYRDLRDAMSEAAFFEVYGNMLSLHMAEEREEIRRKTRFDPRALPAVRQVLDEMEKGGLAEAVVRTGMLLVKAGGGKRNLAQMARARALLDPTGILRNVTEDEMRRLLHEETMVVEFEPLRAKRSLPALVPGTADRRKLRALFDALEDDPHVDDKQRAVIGELRKLVPATAATRAAPRRVARKAPAPAAARRGRAVAAAVRPG